MAQIAQMLVNEFILLVLVRLQAASTAARDGGHATCRAWDTSALWAFGSFHRLGDMHLWLIKTRQWTGGYKGEVHQRPRACCIHGPSGAKFGVLFSQCIGFYVYAAVPIAIKLIDKRRDRAGLRTFAASRPSPRFALGHHSGT